MVSSTLLKREINSMLTVLFLFCFSQDLIGVGLVIEFYGAYEFAIVKIREHEQRIDDA